MKTPNPYRIEPGMIWRRRSGIRSTLRIKTPAIIVVIMKSRTSPNKAVASPPVKAISPIAPLATYCNELIIGVLRISPKTIPIWTIKWSMPVINPPITLKRRSELRVARDVLAIVDMIKVPYLFNPNGMIWLEVVRT
jgi:hypothetical protein